MSSSPPPKIMRQVSSWVLPIPIKLPLGVLWAYGSAAFGQYAADLYINMFIQIFLLDAAKVPAFYAVIGSLVIGVLSDKTKSKYGNRRPWIFWGSICGCLTLLLLFFTVPDSFNDLYRFLFYLFAIILTSVSFPTMAIPHQALASEISDDYDQRLNLAASRSAFSFAGMLLMTVFTFIVFTFGIPTGTYQVWLVLAAFPSAATLFFGIVCFLVMPGPDEAKEIDEVKLYSTKTCCGRLGGLISLPPFVIVVAIFALCGLTQSVTMSLFPLFVVHVLGFGLDTVSQVLIAMIGTTVITTFGLSRLGHRLEKRTLLQFGCVIGIITYGCYFWVPGRLNPLPEHPWLRYSIFLFAAFAGFTNALIFTIPNAMMADVTDLALLKYKAKQEGLMFSTMEMFQSVIQAVTGFMINWQLDRLGYVNAGIQPPVVQLWLRYFFCCIPAAVYFLVWLLSTMYTIDRIKHRQTLKDIRKLKEEIDVTSDILGSGFNVKNLGTANVWEANSTIRFQRDKAKIISDAIQTANGEEPATEETALSPRKASHQSSSAGLNPLIISGQAYETAGDKSGASPATKTKQKEIVEDGEKTGKKFAAKDVDDDD